LQGAGIPVFTYPLVSELVGARQLIGAFRFGITGPPGDYAVLASTNLALWSTIAIASNTLGAVSFVDTQANLFPARHYRTRRLTAPTNMIFIPANTFVMGSPTNELHRDLNEGPQTTVT